MAGFKRWLLAQDEASERPIDLAELASGRRDVICRCNRCGHQSLLIVSELIAQFGPGFPVPEIGGCLRCAGCGGKDIATIATHPSPVPMATPAIVSKSVVESP